MATWQFDSIAVPRKTVLTKFSAIPHKLDMEEFSSIDWWSGINVFKATLHNIVPLAPETKKELIQGVETWGEEDGNRIDVGYSKKDKVQEITIRIDVRDCSEKFILDLMSFLNELDCLIITETGFVVDPKETQKKGQNFFFLMLTQINDSNAKKFVDDPEKFLKNLKRDDETEK